MDLGSMTGRGKPIAKKFIAIGSNKSRIDTREAHSEVVMER
jgi:hypothetical protein